MAKSLRSKWRRKCRAAKREKYAAKELARLKKMLNVEEPEKNTNDETMKDLTITFDAGEVKKSKKDTSKSETQVNESEDSEMEEEIVVKKEGESKVRIFNSKTMKDQYGCYPAWMSQRKIKSLKGNKNKKRNNTHKITKKGKGRRRKNKS